MLKAAEDAISLIKRAKGQWQCYTFLYKATIH
jgi:hypothetical protein